MNWQLKTFTNPILFGFFMLLGYLEAGWLGLVAGIILYGIAITTILLALVPFCGAYLWYNGFMFLANNLNNYIAIPDLIFKISWIVAVIAIFITVSTSTLILVSGVLVWKYRKPKNKAIKGSVESISNPVDTLVQSLPSSVFQGLTLTGLQEIINKIIDAIMKLWEKINKKLVGSIIMFLGIGIASHDFWWECTEHSPSTNRPTHGAYEGLQMTLFGMQLLVIDKSLGEQIKLCLLGYFGIGLCYIGFFLTQFIPKGISRLINHAFWWSGIGLIVYNWYTIMKDDIVALTNKNTKKTV